MLSKWYLDCVSEAGDVFICYAATVRWNALSVNYSSLLEKRSAGPPTMRTSLRGFSTPEIYGSVIKWSSPSLSLAASWRARSPPIERTIFQSELGEIRWSCLAPIADAEINLKDRPCQLGLGYAEHMSMSIPPWQLPIDELRWGRYLSDDDHLTWIDWHGPHPLTLVFHNGNTIDGARVTDGEIICAGSRLTISRTGRSVLREGKLTNTALAMIPGIRNLIPSRILDAYETKWCSKGSMKNPGGSDSAGWVIHEVVRWGR